MLTFALGIAWFAAVLLALLDGRRLWVGWLGVAGLTGSFALLLGVARQVFGGEPIEVVTGGWPTGVGIALRADALGIAFAVPAVGVLLVALLYEVIQGVRERTFPALVLFLAVGLSGVFLTGDTFNFYVFFEVAMVTAFVLTSYGHAARQMRDALTFTVVNLLGSALFLVAVAGLYHVTGTLDMREMATRIRPVESNTLILLAVLLFVAFSLKLGLFPFHFWLPPVYSGAAPAVAAILSGALANIGSYGLLRFGAAILPRELQLGVPVLLLLGTASIVYGAVLASARRTAGEVLAYSSISQAGYVLLSVGLGGAAGYAAAVISAISNVLNKALLFLATGAQGWLVGGAFAVGALSIAGVPPAVGFFGKAAVLQATIARESISLLMVLLAGSTLSFFYIFRIYQRRFWTATADRGASPVVLQLIIVLLAGLVVVLGLWPEPLLRLSRQAALVLTGES